MTSGGMRCILVPVVIFNSHGGRNEFAEREEFEAAENLWTAITTDYREHVMQFRYLHPVLKVELARLANEIRHSPAPRDLLDWFARKLLGLMTCDCMANANRSALARCVADTGAWSCTFFQDAESFDWQLTAANFLRANVCSCPTTSADEHARFLRWLREREELFATQTGRAARMQEALASEPGFCTLCQDDVQPGTPVHVLPCGHAFHNDCEVTGWVKERGSCPVCRVEL